MLIIADARQKLSLFGDASIVNLGGTSYNNCVDHFNEMTADLPKGKEYWMDEIAFLEARLNGSQGDIDSDDRKACEEALKVAKVNLSAGK